MKLFLPKYPALLKALYPERITKISNSQAIYLTFDDGPVPEVTPWVLEILQKYNAKATFFCIGDNVKKHPDIFRRIIQEKHCIGNHSFNHLNGWKTSNSAYVENILKTEQIFSEMRIDKTGGAQQKSQSMHFQSHPNYKLFRPPYGRIKNSQAKLLTKKGYKIVMWDVISGDYDKNYSAGKCFDNVTKNASAGSIIVLHDSKKASGNLRIILPQLLHFYKEKGLEFRSLKDVL